MLSMLGRITSELSRAASLDDALRIVVQRVKAQLAADVCSVYLVDASGTNCVLMATDGLDPRAVGRIHFGQREGLVGLVFESGLPVSVTNAHEHPRFRYFPEYGEEAYHAFVGVPVVHYRRVLGVVAVRQVAARTFTSAEETFLLAIAAQLGAIGATEQRFGDSATPRSRSTQVVFNGIKAAPGVGIGRAVLPSPAAELNAVEDRGVDDPETEESLFRNAVASVQLELRASGERMVAKVPAEAHAMFQVYAALLDDELLFADTTRRIAAGSSAASALRTTIAEHAQAFERMEDPYLRTRAEDIRGLGRRVLLRLQSPATARRQYPERCVLVGEEISVARIADVPVEQLAGIVCTRGSPFSHAAILARTLRIPAVMDVGELPPGALEDRQLLVDGYQGRLFVDPPDSVLEEFQRLVQHEAALARDLDRLRDLPADTLDGVRVCLQANAGLRADIAPAVAAGAEGLGLYRTEFTFMVHDAFPDEVKQMRIYEEVLAAFAPRPVTMRTLDVGGDKPLPYFPITEDNPLLGWRGIRLTLDNPGVFLTQLRAMLRANAACGNLRLLLPMISVCEEVDRARVLIERAYAELLAEGHDARKPLVGIMIEVPSALYQMVELSKRVDFFSIGTNDLTQYILAVDRNNPRVAARYDSLHPAVLRALHAVICQARDLAKPISVCGEMAGEPASAILLVGMGIDVLSMASPSLPRVKQAVRAFTRTFAERLATAALCADDADEVHALLEGAFEQADLGVLVARRDATYRQRAQRISKAWST